MFFGLATEVNLCVCDKLCVCVCVRVRVCVCVCEELAPYMYMYDTSVSLNYTCTLQNCCSKTASFVSLSSSRTSSQE